LLIYLAVSLAVLRLRQRDGMPKEGEYTIPFGPVIPVLSCLFVVGLLLQIPYDEAKTVGALVGICIAIYVIRAVIRNWSKT
jgi:APA family basic amino acid/polyamine antiporter